MTMVRAHLIIEGYVQGVFFRASTKDTAAAHGVTGWVRNLPDGNVEAVLEGDSKSVEAVILWCKKGPPGAMVRNVKVYREDFTGEYSGFSVRY